MDEVWVVYWLSEAYGKTWMESFDTYEEAVDLRDRWIKECETGSSGTVEANYLIVKEELY